MQTATIITTCRTSAESASPSRPARAAATAIPASLSVVPAPHTFSLVPLLLHEVDVPASARAALREAVRAPVEHRREWLEAAAFALTREAHLDNDDARALVGLDD